MTKKEQIDKIKKSLAVCVGASCEGCAYVGIHDCRDKVKRDARACIIKQEKEIEKLKNENARLLAKLGQVLLSIDTVKEMNAMCNIYKQRKDAVQDFAEWVKDHIADVPFCNQKAYNIFCDMVNEKLKEYEE